MRLEHDTAGRGWPGYLLGGRIRTSTVALLIVFAGVWWVYETYEPPPAPPEQIPATDVVPPGFVPDPAYTWVPRTDVRTTTPTTSPTTAPETPDKTAEATTEESLGAPPTGGSPTATPTPSGPPSAAPVTPTRTSAPVSPAPEPVRAPG
ncbi:MAG: hypothetical protein ACKOB8_05835 [Mycobacterium sp.]